MDIVGYKICIKGYCLANTSYIYLIIPLVLILLILLWMNFVKFKKEEEKRAFVKGHRFDRIIFIILRSLVFLLLLIAIASPYTIKERVTEGSPSLTILADNSSSFEIFDKSTAIKLKERLEGYFPVNLKYIAYGERSAIGDGILQNAEGDDHILVISDGYNNYGRDLGDIILFSSILNTTIHSVKLAPIKKDISITIDGPAQVIEQSENTFRVNILNVGNVEYSKLEVFVDGNQVNVDSQGRFKWRFSRGYHKIMARILFPKDDYFEQNNIYYKSVKSLPRPKLLFVTEKSGPLQEALERVYDVAVEESIPTGLEGYDAVILNDINANKISNEKVDLLGNYLSEKGNGAVVVGGENSFDNGGYKNSYFESLLPVKVGMAKRERDERYNVFFIIDLSASVRLKYSSTSEDSVLDVEKALLIEVIKGLNEEDKIAITAHTTKRFCVPKELVCRLTPLDSMPNIYNTIAKLQVPSGNPGTSITTSLMRARQSLETEKGGRNVVILSDGDYWQESLSHLRSLIQMMNSYGIKLYTVGVGYKVRREVLKSMAEKGGGMYFEPTEIEKLKIIFEGDDEKCLRISKGRVLLMDTSHWITKGDLTISANIGGYNLVVPKASGRKLAATDCDRTIITAGRYGLGRIVVLSTDDGSKWSGQLLSKENSKVITRMVNWAVGDFTKDNEFDVRIKDTALGKATDVNVISNKKPKEKNLEFAKIDSGLYSAKFRPEKKGFHYILDAIVGVNYNDEYEKIGLNPKLEELVTISGGYVFDPDDIEKIKDTIISMSRRIKVETINYRWPFIIAALILFLIDVLIRRIRENRKFTS